jgi:hypothetical protein
MREDLIAPCGMNCRLCISFQRTKNPCIGCRNMDEIIYITKGSRLCVIKHCPKQKPESGFCFECDVFPCKRLKDLDKRYRTKYHMSMIENLAYIRDHGISLFLENESHRWQCPQCSDIVCVHRPNCLTCGLKVFEKAE